MPAVLPDVHQIAELVRLASTDLPPDIAGALRAVGAAATGSATGIVDEILANCALAAGGGTPMCQDTGMPAFYVAGRPLAAAERIELAGRFSAAVSICVAGGILRPNAVDALSGCNTGTGVGPGIPQVYFDDTPGCAADAPLTVDLLLKGGGSENMGRQYSLPDAGLDAGRDADGVRRCVIDAAFLAQGFGCSPGIIGVCIGGDRASGLAFAKRQLLRRLDEPAGPFADMERALTDAVNMLDIGPMGLGGFPTVLGVRVGALARHPASFFVSVAYGCWATRRRSMTVLQDGGCSFS